MQTSIYFIIAYYVGQCVGNEIVIYSSNDIEAKGQFSQSFLK